MRRGAEVGAASLAMSTGRRTEQISFDRVQASSGIASIERAR
jgi:hypothetical protein